MKIKELYSRKRILPIVTFINIFTCLLVSVPTYFDVNLLNVFAFWTSPKYFWQVFSGAFEHNIVPPSFLWIHLSLNMLMVVLFMITTEKIIGSFKTLLIFITSWVVCALEFQLMLMNTHEYAVGNSAIGYAFGPIGFYLIYKVIKDEKSKIFKQMLFYLYLVVFLLMLLMLNPMITGVASLVLHGSALGEGIIFLIIYKKLIDNEYEKLKNKINEKAEFDKKLLFLFIIPAFMSVIMVLYYLGYITV